MPTTVKVSNGNKYVRLNNPHISKNNGKFETNGVGYSSNLLPEYKDKFLRALIHCDKLNHAARELEHT